MQRKQLSKTDHTKWWNEVQKIVLNAEIEHISEENFLEKLNSICQKCQISIPRKYEYSIK